MKYETNIIGDRLTLEETDYRGEYIAKWRGLTVATVATESNGIYAGQYAITEWSADQLSTSSPDYASSLDSAWRHIKIYCYTDFVEELRKLEGSRGFHR